MNDSQYKEMDRKMSLLINLLAASITHDKKYREQVQLLNRLGLQSKEIAEITGKSANNVNVTLHLIKKQRGKQNAEED